MNRDRTSRHRAAQIPGLLLGTLAPIGLLSAQFGFGGREGLYECQRDTPSPSIAVGSNWVLQVVNSKIGVWQKLPVAAPQWLNNLDTPGYSAGCSPFQPGFFSGAGGTRIVNAKALFDPTNQRFCVVASQQDLTFPLTSAQGIYIGWSNTNNPKPNNLPVGCGGGGWRVWKTNPPATIGGVTYQPDYNGLGQTTTHVIYSCNLQPMSNPSAPNYQLYRTFPKSLLNSGPVSLHPSLPADIVVGPRPTWELSHVAESFDANTVPILAAISGNNGLRISYIDTTTNSVTEMVLAVPTFLRTGGIAPQNATVPLDTLDGRIQGAVVRNGSLYCCHTVMSGSGIGARNVVRWYQVALNGWPASGSPSLVQSGDMDLGLNAGGQGVHAYHPTIMVETTGHVILGYSRSAANEAPTVGWSGRRYWNPAGTMPLSGILKNSAIPYTSGSVTTSGGMAWGNWTGIAMDDQNPYRIWVCGSYAMTQTGPNPGSVWGNCPTGLTDHWKTWFDFGQLFVFGSTNNYGGGFPGTNGVIPTISAAPTPSIGNTSIVTITNSAGVPTVAVFGMANAAVAPPGVPSPWGGTIWIDPATTVTTTVTMSATDGQVPIAVPNNPTFISVSFFMQALVADAGAAQGFSFTDALTFTIGQ